MTAFSLFQTRPLWRRLDSRPARRPLLPRWVGGALVFAVAVLSSVHAQDSARAQWPDPPAGVVAYAPRAPASVSLREAYKGLFPIGAALNSSQFNGSNPEAAAHIVREFNSVTAENAMKWDALEPRNGEFRFGRADQFVEFALKNHMVPIGHTLCWHTQLPGWVSQPEPGRVALTKEVLLARLRRHIVTVVSRYKGKVKAWDVVNEAIEDHTGAYRPSVFHRVIGPEYLVWAFKWAHEADPEAELYYNDYNLDADDRKRATAIELVKYLRDQGAPIHGLGLQGHYNLNTPTTARIDETIGLFAALGLKVAISELDVEVNRLADAAITGAVGARRPDGTPGQRAAAKRGSGDDAPFVRLTDAQQQAQAKRYGEIFSVFLQHRRAISRVTFWGVRDADSWRRHSSPLLWNDAYGRKPAYDAVIHALRVAGSAREPLK